MRARHVTVHQRARSRARSRGTALVEATVILPVFVILWFTVLYAHNVADAKIRMVTASRATAWGYAMGNCGSSGDPSPTPTPDVLGTRIDPLMEAPGVGSILSSGGGGFMSAITGIVSSMFSSVVPLAKDFDSRTTGTAVVSYRIPNVYTGDPGIGSRAEVGTVSVACNEAPQNGSLEGVLKMVWNAVKPW
jgi:hypothetical protein